MQGINADDVSTFGFDPKLMTEDERREARRAANAKFETRGRYTDNNPYLWPVEDLNGRRTIRTLRYNFVRLNTGEQVRLTPMIDRPDAISETAKTEEYEHTKGPVKDWPKKTVTRK
jgi:hypothetical protein